MWNGNIFDVYPDYKNNVMVVWLTNDGKTFKIEDNYTPSFYIYASHDDLNSLASILQGLSQVRNLDFTWGKTVLGSNQKKLVLEITPKNLRFLSKLPDMINSWGDYYRYQFFNVDIRLPTRYLQSKGVYCNARVKWDGKDFICNESQWSIDYDLPVFKKIFFDIKQDDEIKSFNEPVGSVIVDDCVFSEENEIDTVLSAVKYIHRYDPDIIYTYDGDSFVFPFLYHRAKICGISKSVDLGRDSDVSCLSPMKGAKSYFSYGRIIFRPAFYTLKGRLHIDTHGSFLFSESGLRGIIDISRCSNIPLQLLSRLGPGTAISQIQVNKAVEKGYLVPWKKNHPESWKTAWDLLVSDRGGLILEPCTGLHEDVVELDYASLYPNIMLNYNISPETMLCSCCSDSPVRVPQLGYNICMKQKGLIPEVLEPILSRRFCFKARSKNRDYNQELYKEMQKAWKWILLVCFGYTGYRNARYGRIECHESITAYSRDLLLTAIETAEKAGYKVLHGIIDSLWVKPLTEHVKPFRLSRMISKNTGIKMDVEGRYKWIVFLPSKETNVGALNRYYGMFDNGKLKTRGIELRQRNTPDFLREIQYDMIRVFSQADNSKAFISLIPETVKVIQEYGKKLITGDFDVNSLIFTTCVSRNISEYKVNTLVKSALLQLRDQGLHVNPGQSINYIVKNEQSMDYKKRIVLPENIHENEEIDVDFYLRQIAKCGESILTPFGYTLEKLQDMLQSIKYREKMNVSVLS